MRIQSYLTLCLLAVSLSVALAEPPPKSNETPHPGGALTAFDLEFPGGTPRELVAAIRKASGIPLNAIVPDEFADMRLPGLKMKNVTIPQLFQALEAVSRKTEVYSTSTYGGFGGGFQQMTTGYGFKTEGAPKDDSIWYFYVQKPALPPGSSIAPSGKVCRFYSLTPYLAHGVTVDDITTAISTGWKMLGETSPPEINFHKETKLLIAVGEPGALQIIDSVLKALEGPKPSPATAPPSAPAKKTDQPKPEE